MINDIYNYVYSLFTPINTVVTEKKHDIIIQKYDEEYTTLNIAHMCNKSYILIDNNYVLIDSLDHLKHDIISELNIIYNTHDYKNIQFIVKRLNRIDRNTENIRTCVYILKIIMIKKYPIDYINTCIKTLINLVTYL